MQFVKLLNCPIRGLFPENGGKINWIRAGFDPNIVKRIARQGYDPDGNHVSLLPISDSDKLLEYGIIDTVNNNEFPQDTAEIITQEVADAIVLTKEIL